MDDLEKQTNLSASNILGTNNGNTFVVNGLTVQAYPNQKVSNNLSIFSQFIRYIKMHKVQVLDITLIMIFGIFAVSYLSVITIVPVSPKINNSFINPNQNISIEYRQLIKPGTEIKLTPEAKGKWVYKNSFFGSKLIFMPDNKVLSSNTEYKVNIVNAKTVAGVALPDKTFNLKTSPAPAVASVYPNSESKNVNRKDVVKLELVSDNNGLRKIRAESDPSINLVYKQENEKSFLWSTTDSFEQGKTYTVSFFDDNSANKEPIASTKFTIKDPVGVALSGKQNDLTPDDNITLTFNTPMKTDNKAIINGLEGQGEWRSDLEYSYKISNLQPSKEYEFTLSPNIFAVDGSFLPTTDTKYKVISRGAVSANFEPMGNSVELNKPIVVNFSSKVDKPSAEARFAISPGVAGSFSWQGDTKMIFSPSGYESQQTYVATVNAGVVPTEFGSPSIANGIKFTTKIITVRLDVPLFRQEHISSCEASSAKMALSYRGIQTSENDILNSFGYRPRSIDNTNNSWDDPEEMYVGNVDGAQKSLDAYGAHAKPIAKGINLLGRRAEAHYNISVNFIAQQIHNGNPVIIIGTYGNAPRPVSWNGPNGVVNAWYGQHARVVVGVVGKPSNPIGFYVNDPLVSKTLYWTPQQLQKDIDTIPEVPAQGVVVF